MFRDYCYLWEGDGGITFDMFPSDDKQAIAIRMAEGPCCWPVEVTVCRMQSQITNYRRRGKQKGKEGRVEGDDEKTPRGRTPKTRRVSTPKARSKSPVRHLQLQMMQKDDAEEDPEDMPTTVTPVDKAKPVHTTTHNRTCVFIYCAQSTFFYTP